MFFLKNIYIYIFHKQLNIQLYNTQFRPVQNLAHENSMLLPFHHFRRARQIEIKKKYAG